MTPERLKEYQSDLKVVYPNYPNAVNVIIRQFVRERIQDERATATTNNPT